MIVTCLAFVIACAKPAEPLDAAITNANAATPAAATIDDAPRISLADAKKEFDAGTAIFVDTRSSDTYKQEHVKGAINITFETLNAKLDSLPKGKKIIAYCS